jgi:hypothetical protein
MLNSPCGRQTGHKIGEHAKAQRYLTLGVNGSLEPPADMPLGKKTDFLWCSSKTINQLKKKDFIHPRKHQQQDDDPDQLRKRLVCGWATFFSTFLFYGKWDILMCNGEIWKFSAFRIFYQENTFCTFLFLWKKLLS